MVMSKVTLNVNAPTGIQPQNTNADNSFSDVLGGVSTGRRQAGLQGSSQQDSGGSEFRYTQKAEGGNVRGTEKAASNAPAVTEKTVDAAENMLNEAVTELKKLITEGDEELSEYDILKMLMELIAKQKKKPQDTDDADEMNAAELLMSMLMNISEESGAQDEPVMAAPAADVAAVSEKSGEAAMLTSGFTVNTGEQPAEELPADVQQPVEEFAEVLAYAETAQVTAEELPTAEETVVPEEARVVTSEAPEAEKPEIVNTDDALSKLNDILAKAKDELKLTKAEIKTVQNETEQTQLAETVKPHETAVKVSSDKVDELNSILRHSEKEAPVTEETENTVHTETDNAVHMAAELIDRTEIAENRFPEQEIEAGDVQRPPEVQTADEILSRIRDMEGDRTEFTMVLNPESLGRITVRLVMTGEKVSLDIQAENPETGRLLEARAENLQSTLKNNGVELETYKVVTREEEAQQAMQQDSYDGSSRNPYSRQQQSGNGEDDDDNSFYELLQSI